VEKREQDSIGVRDDGNVIVLCDSHVEKLGRLPPLNRRLELCKQDEDVRESFKQSTNDALGARRNFLLCDALTANEVKAVRVVRWAQMELGAKASMRSVQNAVLCHQSK
jgi:hypothetical protein